MAKTPSADDMTAPSAPCDPSSAGPGSAASDNAPTSQDGPEETQQTAHQEPLKLSEDAAELNMRNIGLNARIQDQPPGPAVTPQSLSELTIASLLAEPLHILST